MAGLTKRPKIPKQPTQVVQYVPTPTPEPVETEEVSAEELNEEIREESLLRRSRGRLGTIFTGFRGLLSEANETPRKSLLGE